MRKALLVTFMLLALTDSALAGISVLGGLTREATLDPGKSREGTIELLNSTEEDAQVLVFQTDYVFFADGSTYYHDPNTISRSNAGWISFSPSRLTIPAGATASVYYKIAVPLEQNLEGTYWSVLMIEPLSRLTPPEVKEQDGKITLGLQTVVRYAIQMITNIGETGESSINLASNKLVYLDGKRMLRTEIENTGERWLSPVVWLELYDESGQYVGRFKSDSKRIFPTCSVSHHLDISEVPDGHYTALFIVDNGDDRVFGANYEMRLKQ